MARCKTAPTATSQDEIQTLFCKMEHRFNIMQSVIWPNQFEACVLCLFVFVFVCFCVFFVFFKSPDLKRAGLRPGRAEGGRRGHRGRSPCRCGGNWNWIKSILISWRQLELDLINYDFINVEYFIDYNFINVNMELEFLINYNLINREAIEIKSNLF